MPNAIDLHVGKRLRRRRRLLGLTQQQLAETIGIRFQQIQKYECGGNRVLASRLHELGVALNVPVAYFFEGLPNPMKTPSAANDALSSDDALTEKEAMALFATISKLSKNQRGKLFLFMKALLNEDTDVA